jgi:LysM repeat protein
MDIAADIGGAVAGLLKHGKAKLVRADAPPDSGGSSALSSALSALPIPGLGGEEKDTEVEFMFNPTEYKLSQSVKVSRTDNVWWPGGFPEYQGTGPLTLSMQAFFDDFGSLKGDVTPKITKLLEWQKPKEFGAPPPLVKFAWGNKQLENFTGVITQLSITYTVFRKDGTPVQAKVDLTIEGADTLTPGTNPTSRAMDTRKVHTVVQGETLASVAHRELGRAGYWRAIASLNGIDDPLRVEPGRALLIPSAADAARNS